MWKSSNSSAAPDIARVMALLTQAGRTPAQVAAAVGVTVRTARRWAAGTQRPNRSNHAGLREWVLDIRRDNAMRTRMDPAVDDLLFAALEALRTQAEQAEQAGIVARGAAPLTTRVDPFAVVVDDTIRALAQAEALFA